MPEEHKEVTPLTDPITEDISKDTSDSNSSPNDSPKDPATPPKKRKSLIAIPLVIITLLAVAAASLFYNQTQQLKLQVQDLINTIEGQKTLPIEETIPEPTIEIPQEATPTATPQTKTETQQALALAQETYPEAQLILITSDNPHLQDQKYTKYWFRQTPDTKKYLYISSLSGQLSMVDQQVFVSPDNNIPSLNQRLEEGKLGTTQDEVLSQANSLCNEPEKCRTATAIKTQFLDTGTNLLWQVTYQIQDQDQSTVFQIDSLTKEVVYQSQK